MYGIAVDSAGRDVSDVSDILRCQVCKRFTRTGGKGEEGVIQIWARGL